MLRVVSAPELGDAAGAVFSVWGSLSPVPPSSSSPYPPSDVSEPALVTFLLRGGGGPSPVFSQPQKKAFRHPGERWPKSPHLLGEAIQLAAAGLAGRGAGQAGRPRRTGRLWLPACRMSGLEKPRALPKDGAVGTAVPSPDVPPWNWNRCPVQELGEKPEKQGRRSPVGRRHADTY